MLPQARLTAKYATLTKTHFVKAQQLIADNGRTLFNVGKKQLQLQPHDAEGHNIQQYGVSAIVYSKDVG